MKIIENRKIWFAISAIVIITGLVFGVVRGFNVGIDFTGGTLMEIDIHQSGDIDEIRGLVNEHDASASVNLLGEDRSIVQIRTTNDLDSDERQNIFKEFQEKYELKQEDLLRADQFGPSVSSEIQRAAFMAIVVSVLGMLAYISYRFEIRFGIAAIIALLHDVLVVISVYAILRIPVNGPFVAAILTILGYSINDTIVVFDRIRENLRFLKKNNYAEIANNSITQTVSRSINTSLTTLICIVALYIVGVEQIKEFALPLMVGVIAGTYSSVVIASPIWVMLKEKQLRKTAPEVK